MSLQGQEMRMEAPRAQPQCASRQRLATTTLSVVFTSVSWVCVGCIGTGYGSSAPVFSPDGRQIAYLWEDNLQEVAVDGRTLSRTIRLRWCKTANPSALSSALVESLGAEFAGYAIDLKWSPNGSCIGVLTPHKLLLVDAESRTTKEVRDGRITSFAWLSDNEFVYCARRTGKGMQQRVVARRSIEAAKSEDVKAFEWRPADEYSWQEYWSPNGQHVAFVEPAVGGRFHIVNTTAGTALAFGQADAHGVGVAWTSDSNRAFCVSSSVGPKGIFEATLLDLTTGKSVDCSTEFADLFAAAFPRVEYLWTADDKYVIVNALRVGGHLVEPHPWNVIRLGQNVKPKLHVHVPVENPRLFRIPVPGWVGIVPNGNHDTSQMSPVTDYSGRLVCLALDAGGVWALSPDGRVAAIVDAKGQVDTRHLGQWWVPSAQSPRSGTSNN